MSLSAASVTRLDKAATDNGFDLERGRDGDWLVFDSSHASLRIWLTALGESLFLVALSRMDVFDALAPLGVRFSNPLPKEAAAARSVGDVPSLHRLLRRAFQLARALPDEPLKVFLEKTANMPRSTEAERLVVQRVGQEVFRDRLLDYWEGRCAITGLAVPELLRASHIKPWADCESDAERLDIFNGLLLAPHLDAAFDRGFITLGDDGEVLVAGALGRDARIVLGVERPLRIRALADGHRRYLPWHRQRVFKGVAS
ncbi:MAG: HNH endonuclease [Myxococcota bacterium]|nr:HNH endonuclease [Myxococcota bacterium]